MKFKAVIYIGATLLSTILLTSCKKEKVEDLQGNAISLASSNITVNFEGHWLNEGDREKLLREMLNEYEFKNQNIRINLKFPEQLMPVVTDADEINFIIDQIKKPVADWDVIRIKEFYTPIATKLNDQKWGEKYLVDFSQIPGFIQSHKSFINDPSLKNQTGGIIMGPYNEGQLWAIYVNKNVAQKMGITVKQYGMTFDDFKEYLKAAYEYNKTHPYIAPVFEDAGWISMEAVFKSLFCSCNGNYDQNSSNMLTPKKLEAIEKCYKALSELTQYEPIIKKRSKINWGRDNDYPLKDSCLFFINGSWMYNIWKQKGKDKMYNIMPCELPVFKESDTYIGQYATNWCVPKNAPHREEAIKLMMEWCKPEMAEEWVRYTKCPSGTKGNMTNTTFGSDPYESFVYNMERKYGERLISKKECVFGIKNYKVQFRIMDLLEGKMTVPEIMAELKKNLIF